MTGARLDGEDPLHAVEVLPLVLEEAAEEVVHLVQVEVTRELRRRMFGGRRGSG